MMATGGGAGELAVLRGLAGQWATDFRAVGPALDLDPSTVEPLLDLPGVRYLSTAGIPQSHGGIPLRLDGSVFEGRTAVERVVIIEELAAGDAGVLLAAPGPSMCGVLVDHLGDNTQQTHFYQRLLDRPTWTFFALTERDHGSDAGSMVTAVRRLDDGSEIIDGAKCYVGNAARAGMGAIFVRSGTGPMAVGTVLLDIPQPGLRADPLPTIGLRGAQICELTLSQVPVGPGARLGAHLSPSRRGLRAGIEVFNRLRPGVAAIGVGIARSALEYARQQWRLPSAAVTDQLDGLADRVDAARRLVLAAASACDDGGDGTLASAAKATAAALAEDATVRVARLLGPAAMLEHPFLEKLMRDARGVEYMEGTRNIQLLNVFRGLRAGSLDPAAILVPTGGVRLRSVAGQRRRSS